MTIVAPHAFITGAAKRIGRELALSLAQQGYHITLHYHHSAQDAERTKQEIESYGARCHLVQGDLAQLHDVEYLVSNATRQGAITLLIHNASLFLKDSLQDVTPACLEHHMRINCFAPVLLSRAFVAQIPEGVYGQIICLLDGMQNWSLSPQFLSYSLSKLALHQFITLTAQSLAPAIRMNGIALGATLHGHMDKEDTFEKTAVFSPLKRNSHPQEVCDTVHYLERTPTITGQIISLASGL